MESNKMVDGCEYPLIYGDSFEAGFIRKSACGSLNNIELVYTLVNGRCTNTIFMVDMDKYISFNTERKCKNSDGDSYNIYKYDRIKIEI